MLTHSELLQLKRWNTPTIYNGWEQITTRDIGQDAFNLDEARDFMPHMGPMVGYAVTLVVQPGNPNVANQTPDNEDIVMSYLRYVAEQPGPKIVVVQDLDSPDAIRGSIWGEVYSNTHKALGCVGTVTDGAIRDLDEMMNAGFKALARRLCVGHAYRGTPVRFGCPVEVFGRRVEPGQLIHADKHGFLAVPAEDEDRLLDAVLFTDRNECDTILSAMRGATGKAAGQVLADWQASIAALHANNRAKFR